MRKLADFHSQKSFMQNETFPLIGQKMYNWYTMNSIQSLACPNCGYPMPTGVVGGTIIKCEACGTTFNVPTSLTPEPDMGNLLLAADFRNPLIPGWKIVNLDIPAEFGEYESQPEYRVTLPPEPKHMTDFLINTPGILDDFDACVSLRFLAGDTENYFAGFSLRVSDDGYYQTVIDSSGRFHMSWFDKSEWGGNLVKWSDQPALRHGFEVRNTMRVLMRGPQIRVYLNGVFSVSLHDARFSAGKLRVIASPYEQEMRLTVSNLQLREARAI